MSTYRDVLNAVMQRRIGHPNDITTAELAAGLTEQDIDARNAPGDVRRYGGVGDGVTDNTVALKRWAKVASSGMRLTLEPGGVYVFDPFGDGVVQGLVFQNASGFVVDGNGATLKAANGSSTGSGRQIIYLRNLQDVVFQNLILDGNRANRTPVEASCHNFQVSTNCRRITVRKVYSLNAVCDCYYVDTENRESLATFPEDITFERDCVGYNAFRNNMSVVNSVRCKISGRYHGANGTAPEDGIDVETGTGTFAGNYDTVLEDVEVSNNLGYGISVGREAASVATNLRPRLSNIRGTSNTKGFVRLDTVTDAVADGLYCGAHSAAVRGVVDLTATAVVSATLRNLTFIDITAVGATNTCIYVHDSVTGRVQISGVQIRNTDCFAMLINKEADISHVQVIDAAVDGVIQILTSSADGTTLRDITIDTCTGRGMYVNAADVEVDGLTLIDCASTTSSGYWAASATRPVVKNVNVLQRTSIPVGARALNFQIVPRVIQNVTARSASTDYTATTMFTFAAGVAGAWISDCFPSATENSGTGTINSGATTATVNHGLGVTPAAKDFSIVFTEQGTNDYGRWWIDTITSTQFRVNVSADPGASNLDFSWNVRVRP